MRRSVKNWVMLVIALLLLSVFAKVSCSDAADRTVFVGDGGVYTVSQIEAGRFQGFHEKHRPFPFSLFEKRGKVITGRTLSDLGLTPEWKGCVL